MNYLVISLLMYMAVLSVIVEPNEVGKSVTRSNTSADSIEIEQPVKPLIAGLDLAHWFESAR